MGCRNSSRSGGKGLGATEERLRCRSVCFTRRAMPSPRWLYRSRELNAAPVEAILGQGLIICDDSCPLIFAHEYSARGAFHDTCKVAIFPCSHHTTAGRPGGDDARRMATTVLTAAAANQPPFLRRYAASAVRAAPPGQPQPASPTKDDQTWVRRSAVQPRMLLQRSRGNRRPRLWKGRWTRCGREQVRNAVHYRARPIGCQDGAQLGPVLTCDRNTHD